MNNVAEELFDLEDFDLPVIDLMEVFTQYAHPDFPVRREEYFIAAPNFEDEEFDDDLDFLPEEDIIEDDDFEEGYGFITGDHKAQYQQPEEVVTVTNSDVSSNNKGQEEPSEAPEIKEGNLLLAIKGVTKQYKQGGKTLKILNGVNLRISAGEITALIGPSGSGKSTLLHILGLLDTPSAGQIIVGGRDVTKASDIIRTELRGQYIGFIYQFHHLLPEFTAQENVAMPQIIAGKTLGQANKKAKDLLVQLGLEHRLNHRPATLSGGEQQRVAIARALANDPYLLFADEPTGNLDPET
ncbi:MAG: ABC transporter ATP-binding protein, partial [Alphaproteobacteria bacterium]|nr:ABC transporter ATP-binding protein [Alphaproteobacteria bacterium]